MSSTRKERLALKHKYFSKSWSQQIDKMSDAQVIALYLRFKSEGRLS